MERKKEERMKVARWLAPRVVLFLRELRSRFSTAVCPDWKSFKSINLLNFIRILPIVFYNPKFNIKISVKFRQKEIVKKPIGLIYNGSVYVHTIHDYQ